MEIQARFNCCLTRITTLIWHGWMRPNAACDGHLSLPSQYDTSLPVYLSQLCKSTAEAVRRRNLHSCAIGNLDVPRTKPSTFGHRAFSAAVYNSLPDYLKDSNMSFQCITKYLKTFLFTSYQSQSLSVLETFRLRAIHIFYCIEL